MVAGPGAVGIEFSQVGKDQGAQRFLATLDKDPEVGKIIDATSYYVSVFRTILQSVNPIPKP